MPKRYFDTGSSMDVAAFPEKTQRKTERSHEENQERAYIAASRRADRSIEARVQSARMASEIHKKRTGKAFRITEEIVMKEEMYEEEDDDFPRSYRLLGPHMQTASPEMNSRVEAYLTNRVVMSQMLTATEEKWRQNDINKAFAQAFPSAERKLSQHRWSSTSYDQSTPVGHRYQSPTESTYDGSFRSVNYGPNAPHHERHRSLNAASPTEMHLDVDNTMSPPDLTPGSHSDSSHQSRTNSSASVYGTGNMNHMGSMQFEHSAFTPELPAEAKMLMAGVDGEGVCTPQMMFNQDWMNEPSHMYNYCGDAQNLKPNMRDVSFNNYHPQHIDPSMTWDNPTPAEEPSWDAFINDGAWTNEQQ